MTFPRTKSLKPNELTCSGATGRKRKKVQALMPPAKRRRRASEAIPSAPRPASWLPLNRERPDSSLRNRVVRADHANLVVGEFHRNIHHLHFLHVTANAVLA